MERKATDSKIEAEQFVTRRMVIKIGTSTITGGKEQLDMDFMEDIARQCSELYRQGVGIVIVSSGAVAAGKGSSLGEDDILGKQVEAMFGQSKLISAWRAAFEKNGIVDVAQALYTDEDFYRSNTAQVLLRALERGPVVVNCNDAVTDSEMRQVAKSADNDKMGLEVARLIDADLILLLGDVDGVMDGDTLINWVDRLEYVEDLIRSTGTGTGGPWSKWSSAHIAAQEGRRSMVANGRELDVILKAARGESVGTLFTNNKYMFS